MASIVSISYDTNVIITNSLGSNYTAEDRFLTLKLLFQPWKWQNGRETELLKQALLSLRGITATKQSQPDCHATLRVARNDVSVHLFYKGRHAIYEALLRLKIGQGDEVIVQAFTCVAVVQPILDLGATPIYVDVDSKNLNPSLDQIKMAVTSNTKGIILQHTLGYINRENDKIVEWCKNRKIFVIQDLAHAFGAPGLKRSNPAEAGLDLNIVSFSQDKVIDGISGGSLVIVLQSRIPLRRTSMSCGGQSLAESITDRHVPTSSGLAMTSIIKLLLYPMLTHLIRSTYSYKLGKIIHFCAKNLNLLPSPLDAPSTPTKLPNALAAIALNQLNKLEKIIAHRRNIALVYDRMIQAKLKLISPADIKNGSCLRYPLWVGNRDELENKLTKHGFYLMDHWYDAPVSPEWVNNAEVGYHLGSCPNAENLSEHIFNLPTHINILLQQAEKLARLINRYTS